MNEIFKNIPNYEGVYEVSNKGRVKRILKDGKEKFNKLTKLNNGYLAVQLSLNNKGKIFQIHQLVAMAFLNHKPCGHKIVVDHINNNPLDNIVDNLQIVSHRENLTKDKKGYSSEYVGVTWHKVAKKWVSHLQFNGKKEYLGLFTDELDAAKAYKERLNKI
jgi:hypothetical protein|tara:strand:- start:18 stop:500 length:483 start_codon:yes stop_codon:yes gene_type:complete